MTLPILLAQSPDIEVNTGELRFLAHGEVRRLRRADWVADPDPDRYVWCRHRNVGVALAAGESVGVMGRVQESGACLVARVTVNGLYITKLDASLIPTDLGSIALTAPIAADADHWPTLRCVGNTITAEHWLSVPDAGGSYAKQLVVTLAGGDIATYGAAVGGSVGMFGDQATTWAATRFDDFSAYRRRSSKYGIAEVFATNALGSPTPEIIRVAGPVTNALIRNVTTGQQILMNYTLAAGRTLRIHSATHRAWLDDGTDLTTSVDASSTFWSLAPGQNRLRLYGDTYQAAARLGVDYYRPSLV